MSGADHHGQHEDQPGHGRQVHPGQAPGDRPPVEAADPAQQQRPSGDRPDQVRDPVRDGQPGDHVRGRQHVQRDEGARDADAHHEQADEGGGPAVLERVEDPQLQLGEHVGHQAEGEQAEDLADVSRLRGRAAAVGEQELGHRRAEHGEVDRRRDHEHGGQPDADREVVPDQRVPARAGVLAHPGQQRRDHRDADDRVGQLEQLPGVGVRGITVPAGAAATFATIWATRLPTHVVMHVDRHPAGHPAHLGHLAGPEPERGPPPEPGRPQRREQRDGLRHDAERGADPEQLHGGAGIVDGVLVQAHRHHVEAADDDHDQVVDDRCPHRRREPAPGVQDRPDQRAHPVEEDLRDEEVGPHHHQVVLGAVDGGGVQVDQRPGGQRRHQVTVNSASAPRVNIRCA